MPVPHSSEDVRRYYDDNTRLLLGLGQGTEGTIRRAVWGAGVQSRHEAMAYVDELVAARVREVGRPDEPPRVLDLGCGVGASLCRIAASQTIVGTGVTLSAVQVELAQRRIATLGLSASVECVVADYTELPHADQSFDLAFAIESFVHAPSASRFFAQCARVIRPGGLLIVCDDFLASRSLEAERTPRRWLDRYRKGWVVSSLLSTEEVTELAIHAGFTPVETLDFSGQLELGRPRDLWIAGLMRGFGWLPVPGQYWSMLLGGHALQVCLRNGWIRYAMRVWRRNG